MSVVLSILGVVGGVLLFLLKCIGILLLVVLALAVLLMLCPFCADVLWENETLTVKAGALGITFPVFRYPAPEKPKKEKKKKSKKKPEAESKPKPEATPRKKAKLTLNIVCTILRGAGKLTKAVFGALRITKINICLGVRGEDPAEAARAYGSALGLLDRFLYLDFEQLRLVPDLGPDQPTVEDRVSFRVTAQAYAIVFTALRVLYEFWHEKVLDLFL